MVPVFLPSVLSVSAVACRFGASSVSVRPSSRALAGFVFAAGFRSYASAGLFARWWAPRLPSACRGCAVRRSGGFFVVSVPVLAASVPVACWGGLAVSGVGSPPACRAAVVAGGVWAPSGGPPAGPAPAPAPASVSRPLSRPSVSAGASGRPARRAAPASSGVPCGPVFPSRSLAVAWAVACGVAVSSVGAAVAFVPGGGWCAPGVGAPVGSSCAFCQRLGQCSGLPAGGGSRCPRFAPGPRWPVAAPRPRSLF